MPENTDAFLESLSYSNNSFLTLHPKIETPQQPPSVELQMRVSPNLFDNSLQNQDSPPKPSVLSMDLFNSIDFDKLSSLTSNHDLPQNSNLTRTFNRPRPGKKVHRWHFFNEVIQKIPFLRFDYILANHRNTSSQQQQQQANIKSRDDRQILERLTQQANKFHTNEKCHPTREHNAFKNLESALYASSHEYFGRHGKRSGIPESEVRILQMSQCLIY